MYNELPFSNHVMQVPELDIVVDTIKQFISLHEGVGGNVINTYDINELQSLDKGTHIDIIQKSSNKIQLRGLTLGNVYVNGQQAGTNIQTMNDTVNAAFAMSLTDYKDFLETQVGVQGSEESATFYYIESPDGTYHYPLFKTEAEANSIDTQLGGSGTSHTHTYADDLSNTTWYMPDVSNHMSSSVQPVNGLYTAPNGGTVANVIWNIQSTGDDSNYAPTFTDITYTVQEGSNVNIQYKPQGDTNSYNVTNVPTGYVDNGYAIIGTADTITDGVDIQYVINVTKANDFGSVQGTITLDITDDPSNNSAVIDTPWSKAVDFDGGAEYLQNNNDGAWQSPLKIQNSATIALPASYVNPTTNSVGNTSSDSNARPWATAIVFKPDYANSNQHIWNFGAGTTGSQINIFLRLGSNKNLYFGWGKDSDKNECYIGNLGSNTNDWIGVYVGYNGARFSQADATAANLRGAFDIRLSTSGADGFVSSTQGQWDFGHMLSNQFTSNLSTTGYDMGSSMNSSRLTIGGRVSNRSFNGKVAMFMNTTLRTNQPMPSTAEIELMVKDPVKWLSDYKDGQNYRVPNEQYDRTNFEVGSTTNYNYFGASTQLYIMGDGTTDSFNNQLGIK